MIDAAYSMDEAARRVPCCRRWLQDFLRENPADKAGMPFYYPKGNRKMFTDADITSRSKQVRDLREQRRSPRRHL